MSLKMGNNLKEHSTNQFNKKLLSERCGVNDTLTFIGKRWLMAVLYEISLGNNQFSLLKREMEEISEHLLASRIKDLFNEGLLEKQEIEATIPLQIIYIVTKKGEQLLKLVNGLCEWNKDWK